MLLAALGLLGTACAGEPAAERTSVLLVVIDTLRADKLGCYGNERGLSPAIDRLAAEGVVFERAFAHAPWTLPSVASLLTSRNPAEHGAGGWIEVAEGRTQGAHFRGLEADVPTLAERFRDAGYATAAVVNVDFLAPPFGLTRGFDHVDAQWSRNNRDDRPAGETTARALEWLADDRHRPFFLLVHYFDPHTVYAPPPAFRRRCAAAVDRGNDAFVFGTREDLLRLRSGQLALDPEVLERAERLYDGEIAYADREIGRLLDGLDRLGLAPSTLAVLTSDHGEEFLDHGGFEHGHTLYDELLHVPLVLRLPEVLAPRRIARRVRLIDVAPTVCELAGVAGDEGFAGLNLFAQSRPSQGSGEEADRPVVAYGNFWGPPRISWRSGPYKLILDSTGPEARAQLFRPAEDPHEQHDLSSEEPQVLGQLLAELRRHRSRIEARSRGREIELSPEERRRLRALGYLGPESGDADDR